MKKAEIIAELKSEIKMYKESYKEGEERQTVKNPGALRTIKALKEAIKIIQNYNKKGGRKKTRKL